MNLKSQIKAYLKARGMSPAELSRRTKVPRQTISNWLAGCPPRSFDHLKNVAEELGCTVDHLLFGEDTHDPYLMASPMESENPDVIEGIYEVRLRRIQQTPSR